MGQRKLTQGELRRATRAAWYLRSVINHCGLIANGGSVLDHLNAIEAHGTTDGKPYVEPQPEIGEWYRYAIESDVNRLDVERWDTKSLAWHVRDASRRGEPLDKEITYRVPIDRIPTDEDAKQRPTVMVTATITDEWLARPLLAVTATGFLVKSGDGFSNWKKCRFPYPGELD